MSELDFFVYKRVADALVQDHAVWLAIIRGLLMTFFYKCIYFISASDSVTSGVNLAASLTCRHAGA